MLLRIEDTDRERSTKAAIDAILDGLSWLGLDWDGDTVYQFSRVDAASRGGRADAGVGQGLSLLRLARRTRPQMREKARAEGKTRLYDGRWRDRDPADAPPGVKPAIRLKAPLTGETVIEDQVQGRVTWQNENLDDLVLLRSDGTPTYMLAVVVDDHDMGVTHIIRGDDHLNNARAADPDLPGARLDGAGDGAHPADPRAGRLEALQAPRRARRRCLPRHGLSAGGDAQLSGAARLEPRRPGDLLDRGDDRGLRPAADRPLAGALRFRQARKPQRPLHARERRTATCWPRSTGCCRICRTAPRSRRSSRPPCASKLMAAMPGLKERAKTLVELVDAASFIWADRPLALDDKAAALLTPEARGAARRGHPGARSGRALDRGGDRTGGARLCRAQGRQARRGRAAAAGGPDRPDHLARHFRRAGGAGPAGKPGAAARIRRPPV